MDVRTILDKLDGIGVAVRVKGDRLQMNPGRVIPQELMEEVKNHKKDLILHLTQNEDAERKEPTSIAPPAWVIQPLEKALKQKREELATRKRDLVSHYYADDEWTKQQVIYIQTHIADIERYLSEGGELKLPRCCRQPEYICLIATKGFNECIMIPEECGFSLIL